MGVSRFAHLPTDVVCPVFRRLSLRDRLVCEQVSRSWLILLRCLPGGGTRQAPNAIWGDGIRVLVKGPLQARGKIRVAQYETVMEVQLHATELTQTSTELAFVLWFKRLSQAFGQVTIVLRTRQPRNVADKGLSFAGGWLFPQLVAALYFAGQSAMPESKLHIVTGMFGWKRS